MKCWGALGERLYPGLDVRSNKLFINKPFYAFQLTGKANSMFKRNSVKFNSG